MVIPKMTADEAEQALVGGGFRIVARSRLPTGKGEVMRLDGGPVVNVFDSGTIQVQGKDTEELVEFLEGLAAADLTPRAPAISDKPGAFAMYQPELEGKHVLVVTADEIRKIALLFNAFSDLPISCAVFLEDGYMRTMTIDELCAHENAPRQPIRMITIHTDSGEDDPKAEIQISNIGADTIEITIYGEPHKVEALRHGLEDRLASMTPGYSWIAKRDVAPLAMLTIFGFVMTLAAGAWGPAIAVVVFGMLVSQKNRYFPRTFFRVGQGEKRFESAETMRIAVLLGVAVSIASTLILGLLGL